ncbi:MAG: restriction endonuclease subunit S [Moraxellaceae bacterium]|nr:restriction endonuclease subunit S [Moraxellaceae bacterium]
MSWPLVKLGDIFDIARGGSPRPIDDYLTEDDDGINWISIKDASDSTKYIFETKRKIKPSGLSKTRQVKSGDFLLTNSMSFGRPYIMKTSGCIHDGWLVLSGDLNKIDQDYFYYLLGSDTLYKTFSGLAAGAVVKNLNIDIVKNVVVSLPPLAEQKRIAAILDKADAIRRKRQQAIKLADEFLRSVFLDMFGDPVTNPKGWEVKELHNGILSIKSGWSAKGADHPCGIGQLGVLKISAVTSGIFKKSENKCVPFTEIPDGKNLIFPKKGDLLFSRANTRELVAATCIISEDENDVFLPDKLWLIETDKKQLLPEFLHHLIWHPKFKDTLTSQANKKSSKRFFGKSKKF